MWIDRLLTKLFRRIIFSVFPKGIQFNKICKNLYVNIQGGLYEKKVFTKNWCCYDFRCDDSVGTGRMR